jgi:DNA-binding GntR family transcriptional regulator
MGLVERVPNKGARVKVYSDAEVEALYDVRTLIEREAALQMPLAAPADLLSSLRNIQTLHDCAIADGDLGSAFRRNIDFHQTLFANCRNQYLTEMIEVMRLRAHGTRFYSLSSNALLRQAALEHWTMIETIERGDNDGLAQLCASHLVPTKRAYLQSRINAFAISRSTAGDLA